MPLLSLNLKMDTLAEAYAHFQQRGQSMAPCMEKCIKLSVLKDMIGGFLGHPFPRETMQVFMRTKHHRAVVHE